VISTRPSRRMPTMKRLLMHWEVIEPHCFKCLVPVRKETLVRAHLIDRCRDGLDGAQNLVPLCDWCHDRMPSFGNGDEESVLQWIHEPWEGFYHDTCRLNISRHWDGTLQEFLNEQGCSTLHEVVVKIARFYVKLLKENPDRFELDYEDAA